MSLTGSACRVGVALGDEGTFFCFLPADDLIMSRTFLGGNSLDFVSLYMYEKGEGSKQ